MFAFVHIAALVIYIVTRAFLYHFGNPSTVVPNVRWYTYYKAVLNTQQFVDWMLKICYTHRQNTNVACTVILGKLLKSYPYQTMPYWPDLAFIVLFSRWWIPEEYVDLSFQWSLNRIQNITTSLNNKYLISHDSVYYCHHRYVYNLVTIDSGMLLYNETRFYDNLTTKNPCLC